jgi:flagellar hook-associated protein 2
MATTSNIVSTLGAGSGIDIKKLSEDLVAAERAPRQEIIDQRLARSEARVSGYGVVRYSLQNVQNAFAALKDASDFTSITPRSSQPDAVGVTAGAGAPSGRYSVEVTRLAAAQREASAGYGTSSAVLNGNVPFDLTLTVGSAAAETINVTTPTVGGVVSAINSADLGVTAQLVNAGGASPWRIVVTGKTGAANGFTLTSAAADLSFGISLGTAADASFSINGLAMTRSTNSVSDAVQGLTFELYAPTAQDSRGDAIPATVDLTRDTSGVRQKVEALVAAYNEAEANFKILTDRKSEVEEFGGALAGDNALSALRAQLRGMVMVPSSAPGGAFAAGRDIGLSFDRYGVLQLDAAKLDKALQGRFADVVSLFTANAENQSVTSTAPGGLAGDAYKRIDALLRTTGLLAQQTTNAVADVDRHKADLERLEERMSRLLERYTRQFTAMESIVGNATSLRTGLSSSFDGLMAMYTRR